MISLKQRVKKALSQLKGKDLSRFGIWAKSELEFMKKQESQKRKI